MDNKIKLLKELEPRRYNNSNYYIYPNGKVFNIKTKKFLKGYITKENKITVRLTINRKTKHYFVDKLVLETFTNQKYKYIIHLDGDRTNNSLDNLKGTNSLSEMHQYYIDNQATNLGSNRKKVYKFTKDGKFLTKYDSIKEASKLNNIHYDTLRNSLKRNHITMGKYIYSLNKWLTSKKKAIKSNNIITWFSIFEKEVIKNQRSLYYVNKKYKIHKQILTSLKWLYNNKPFEYLKLKANGYLVLNGKKVYSVYRIARYFRTKEDYLKSRKKVGCFYK